MLKVDDYSFSQHQTLGSFLHKPVRSSAREEADCNSRNDGKRKMSYSRLLRISDRAAVGRRNDKAATVDDVLPRLLTT